MGVEVVDVLLRAKMEASEAVSGVSQIQKALQGLTLPKNISADLEKSFGKLGPLLKDYQKQLDKGFSSQKDLKNFNLLREKVGDTFNEIKSKISEINGQEIRIKTDVQAITKMETELNKLQSSLQDKLGNIFKTGQTENSINDMLKSLSGAVPARFTALTKQVNDIKSAFKGGDFANYNRQLDTLHNNFSKLGNSTKLNLVQALNLKGFKGDVESADKAFSQFIKDLQVNKNSANAVEHLRQQIKALVPEIEQAKLDAIVSGAQELAGVTGSIDAMADSINRVGQEGEQAGASIVSMTDQVNQLQQSTQYFFSLRNMINLFKRGIDDAVQSVKELDAAMTETAVVTDYKVSDLWGMLPEYTKVANQLGATTLGAYETMTLYYQQGLDQQQAFELGAETMKMARIAGLDYAETTDMMTAALRGFNMELDETSAKRVNDVYSELAAITASDTEELGTAMQRTASIAHSAGSSFEGTTAFLAQAIETTREPAENIGTAMKTIIARFQEMKKNPLEISEVDGEEVDYNKIDAALKTIGVDLKDTAGQFRNFDEVMLDISARWDTLSQSQQRYIATTAAGSRQQSRFIAMVSNYERTMQLMEAANNSAGASDEQFGKTMDSLESKLNQLHNAWEQFTMGIANNNMIKTAVDGLTGFLNITNRIIDTLSFGSGALKSFLSIFAAFTGLKTLGRAANAAIGGLGGLVDPKSSIKEGFKTGLFGAGRNQLQADRISSPIVKAIYSLIPHIDKSVAPDTPYRFQKDGDYGGARTRAMNQFGRFGGKGYSISNLSEIFRQNELNSTQQQAFFKASPGLKKGVTKSLASLFKEAGMSPEVSKGLMQGFNQGKLTLDEILANPALQTNSFASEYQKVLREQGRTAARQLYNSRYQDEYNKGIQKGLSEQAAHEQAKQALPLTDSITELLDKPQQLTGLEKFSNVAGQIGAGFTQAGMSLQMFGSQLSAVNPVVGQAITNFGSLLTTVGSFANTIPALLAMGPVAAGIAGAAALIGGAFAIDKIQTDKIKKAATDVTDSFKETNKQTQDNIATLKAYRGELATLSQGVDQNGNNIDLSDSDYSRYLEIVDSIAEMNPEIVQGYNAQGHAIINNNTALEDTLALQKQIQNEATKEYLEPESLEKIVAARNLNKNYAAATTTVVGEQTSKWKEEQGFGGTTRVKAAPMTTQVKKIASELEKTKDLDINSILNGYNISLNQLLEGEANAVNTFVQNQDKITSAISTQMGGDLGEALTKSLEDLSTQTANFEEAIKPTFDWLSTYISQNPIFEQIPNELRPAMQKALQGIAGSDSTFDDMMDGADDLALKFDSLADKSGNYAQAMEQVEKIQNDFADSLDAEAYTKALEEADGPIKLLEEELDKLQGKTDAVSQAQREFLQGEIESIKNFTTSNFGNLTAALNTLQDNIAAAEGAFDAFSEATKSDYSTAVKGMENIYDKVFEEVDINGSQQQLHTQGQGDKTFWAGAEAVLGKKAVENSKATVQSITKQMERLKPALQQGKDGYYGFLDLIDTKYQNANDKTKQQMENLIGTFKDGKLDEFHIDEKNFSKVAELLGMSNDSLTSMLHNAMQFADLDFMNADEVRKNLATSDQAIAGLGTTNGKQNMYVDQEYLRQQILDAGYEPKKVESILAKLEAQGIKTIPPASEIKKETGLNTADFFKQNLGINSPKDLISSLIGMGTFSQSQIEEYVKGYMGKSFDAEAFQAEYKSQLQQQEDPTGTAQLNELSSIHSVVANILSSLDPTRDDSLRSTTEDFQQQVKGGLGDDTVGENYAKGLDKDGNILTKKTQKESEEALNAINAGLEDSIAQMKLEAETATGTHKATLEAQIAAQEALLKLNKENKAAGDKAYAANKKAREAEEKKTAQTNAANENKKYEKRQSSEAPIPGMDTHSSATVDISANDNATPVIEETEDKLQDLDGEKAEPEVNADTSDAEDNIKKAKKDLKDLDGDKAETTVTTTTEQPKAFKPQDTTVNILGNNQGAINSATEAVSTINGMQGTISINGNNQGAINAANSAVSSINSKSASISVTAKYSGGTVEIPIQKKILGSTTVESSTGGYIDASKGVLYRAKGGDTLFKPKGTDTVPAMLTPGEYVQQRSAVQYFGTDFMQQINHKNLPGALATLKKETLYRAKGGSVYLDDGGAVNGKVTRKTDNNSSSVTITIKSDKSDKKGKKDKKDDKDTDKPKIKTSKKIYDWWEAISRKVDAAKRNSDQLGKELSSILKDIRATTDSVKNVNKDYIKAQNKTISLNKTIRSKATKQENRLARRSDLKQANKAVKKAQTKVNKAKTKKEKKDARAELKNAKNERNKIKKRKDLKQTVKWTEKTKKGKKKEQSGKVNLSQYITRDSTGALVVNKKAINKLGASKKGGKAKAKAVQEAAYKEIDKQNKRKVDAQDAIREAQENLASYRVEIDDTFFGWVNELTKVYKWTSKIETLEAKISKSRSLQAKAETQLDYIDLSKGSKGAAGLNTTLNDYKNATDAIQKGISDEISQKQELQKALAEEIKQYEDLGNAQVSYIDIKGNTQTTTEKQRYKQIKSIGGQGSGKGWDQLSENDKKIYTRGRAFEAGYIAKDEDTGEWTFNEKAIKSAIDAGEMTEDFGQRLKELFDNLHENQLNQINTESEIIDLETEQLQNQHDYEDKVKSISEQLYGWKNSLTKILELTNKIAATEARISYAKVAEEYYQKKRSVGGSIGASVTSANIYEAMAGTIISQMDSIQKTNQLADKQRADLQKYIRGNDIDAEIKRIKGLEQTDLTRQRITDLQEEKRVRDLASDYIKTKTNADGTVTITLDEAGLERDNGVLFDSTIGPKIEEVAQTINSKSDELKKTQLDGIQSVNELLDTIINLRKEYADRAKELREAYIAQQQKEIDDRKTLYSAIDSHFKTLISEIQKSISERRQREDNSKTERDISQKQQRLAMLRADTSGGNQVEIARLQKEITDSQQGYGRTLEDQLISKISTQGDLAARQRDEQIQLLQALHTASINNGTYADLINQWLQNPVSYKDAITSVLTTAANWNSLTSAERTVVQEEVGTKFASLTEIPTKIDSYVSAVNTLKTDLTNTEKNIKENTKTALETADKNLLEKFKTELKTPNEKLDTANSGIQSIADAVNQELTRRLKEEEKKRLAQEAKEQQERDEKARKDKIKAEIQDTSNKIAEHNLSLHKEEQRLSQLKNDEDKLTSKYTVYERQKRDAQKTIENSQKDIANLKSQQGKWQTNLIIAKQSGNRTGVSEAQRQIARIQQEIHKKNTALSTAQQQKQTAINDITQLSNQLNSIQARETDIQERKHELLKIINQLQQKLSGLKYASGGLSTSTGPAWLDGTPSKPELVLNAADTKNFIALKDVLSRAVGASGSIEGKYGDMTYEININVEKLTSDYDVDKVADRVKKIIVKDASYRNVTQVRNLR